MNASSASGKRVLLVEDEYFIVRAQTRALALFGVQVVGSAATVEEALRLARAEDLDGALLDINLRGANVYPVADLLRARGVPFVFVTGYDDPAIPEPFQEVPWCKKPVGMEKLIDLLFGSDGRSSE